VSARVVVNAAGPQSDAIRRLDDAGAAAALATSQGVHIVLAGAFLGGDTALMVPRTRDGRVVFAIPWHGHTMVGTTDTPTDGAPLEPRPLPAEIEFLLETVAPYLSPRPQASDIRSLWAGIRPLVRRGSGANTSQLGRDHAIDVAPSGLVSITGGKWTTYRKMAEDCVDRAAEVGGLAPAACRTKSLPIHGGQGPVTDGLFANYGSDAPALAELIASWRDWSEPLAERFPHAAGQVVWAARHEMARTVEDVLARRLRILFLDAEAAIAVAPLVAALLAGELGKEASWQSDQVAQFQEVAAHYRAVAPCGDRAG
jgi:glycerol-3-phosphate dehydrogenase